MAVTGESLANNRVPGTFRADGSSSPTAPDATLTRPKADGDTGSPRRSFTLDLEGPGVNRYVSVRRVAVLVATRLEGRVPPVLVFGSKYLRIPAPEPLGGAVQFLHPSQTRPYRAARARSDSPRAIPVCVRSCSAVRRLHRRIEYPRKFSRT